MNETLINSLEKLNFCKYRFNLVFHEKTELPEYHGSFLRGTFGTALKEMFCINESKDCKSCLSINKCNYPIIFERDLINENSPPHFYVIEIGKLSDNFLFFDIILLSEGLNYLSEIIYAVKKMGTIGFGYKRHKFSLSTVEYIDMDNSEITVYKAGNEKIKKHTTFNIKNLNFDYGNKIKIVFKTPVAIKSKNTLLIELDFSSFFKSLIHRISGLFEHFFHQKLDIVFDDYLESSKNIETIEKKFEFVKLDRYSNRREEKVFLTGTKGYIVFSGNLEKFLPFIVLCQYIHTGKATTFGFGQYEIENLN